MGANDTKNLFIPVSRFLANATLPVAPAKPEAPSGYTIDFGKFEKGILKISGDLKEVWKANTSGMLGLAALRRVKAKLVYEFELKYLEPAFLAYYMGSASGAAPAPGKIIDLYGWAGLEAEDEPIVGTGSTNEGAGILTHYGFKFGLQLDGDLTANGDDFAMLKLQCHEIGRAHV